jgi:hypothetical protein
MWYFEIGRFVGGVTGAILFVALWCYGVITYGFWIGGGVGWLPSLIAAAVIGALLIPLWSFAAVGAGVLGYLAFKDSTQPIISLVCLAAVPLFIGWVVLSQVRDWRT